MITKFYRGFPFSFLLLIAAAVGQDERNIEPEIFTLTFSQEISELLDGAGERPEEWPDWIVGIDHRNGILTDDGAWQSAPGVAEAEAAFNLLIDNEVLQNDIALTLSYSAKDECDFVIQIYDSGNRVVAVDLFGNVNENSILAGTDTYIIPVSRYPSASRISLRKVRGQLTIYGMVAFPVLGELTAEPEAEMTMLKMLGGELSKESRLYRALNNLVPETDTVVLTDDSGEPLSREKVIASLRTEVIKEISKTKTEFEQRLIGTEWYLEDFYRKRLARFLPDGRMLQQHVDDRPENDWDEELPQLERGYKVLDEKSVIFGIGGFVATFNENFTEMTYETASGRKGNARLTGRFNPQK